MNANIKRLEGIWNEGFALDKHSIHSIAIGVDVNGHVIFDTTRSQAGEALYQLKYQQDPRQTDIICNSLCRYLGNYIDNYHIIIPMQPSNRNRRIQPVIELAKGLSVRKNKYYTDQLLTKPTATTQIKNIGSRERKIAALMGAFRLNDFLDARYIYNVLIIDDIFDSGSSLEAATNVLRTCTKIDKIGVLTVTWK